MGKALQLLIEATPQVARIGVLSIPTSSLHVAILKELEVAAGSLRVRLQPFGVATPEEIESAVTTMTRNGADALITLDDPFTSLQSRRIADLALQHRLPTVSTARLYPENGALMSYGARFDDLFKRAATYVDKILKGAKPGDLPVEQPTKFELVVNLKTARALGITVPPTLLARADEVIE
jgi:putative ABC transport system substrate-binding protein